MYVNSVSQKYNSLIEKEYSIHEEKYFSMKGTYLLYIKLTYFSTYKKFFASEIRKKNACNKCFLTH